MLVGIFVARGLVDLVTGPVRHGLRFINNSLAMAADHKANETKHAIQVNMVGTAVVLKSILQNPDVVRACAEADQVRHNKEQPTCDSCGGFT